MMFSAPRILKSASSGSPIFIVACIEPKFTEYLDWFLTHQTQVHSKYDQFALAGASLGAIQSLGSTNPTAGGPSWPVSNANYPHMANWGGALMDHISLATQLHGISEVWVFEHLDCDAYKNFQLATATTTDLSAALHVANLVTLKNYLSTFTSAVPAIQTSVRALHFKGFVMKQDGSLTLSVDDGNGMSLLASSAVNSHNGAIGVLIGILVIAVGLALYASNTTMLKNQKAAT